MRRNPIKKKFLFKRMADSFRNSLVGLGLSIGVALASFGGEAYAQYTQASVTINDDCGQVLLVGTSTIIEVEVDSINTTVFPEGSAPFRLLIQGPQLPQPAEIPLGNRAAGEEIEIPGRASFPGGLRTLTLQVQVPSPPAPQPFWTDVAFCSYLIVDEGEYLVEVLSTTWENNIFADPPSARMELLQTIQGPPNVQTGYELELPWLSFQGSPAQPLPTPAQGNCFRVRIGPTEFWGQAMAGVLSYQRLPCAGERRGGSAVRAELTVDRGCGATYAVGDPITVIIIIRSIDAFVFGQPAASFQLLDVLADGSTQVFDLGILNDNQAQGRTVQIQGTITPPVGTETLILQVLMPNGQWQEVARCSFQVTQGQGQGAGQVLLTLQALTPQGEASVQLGLTIDPPAGGWMLITTPYQQILPQGTSIRLEAPATINQGGQEYAFDHWEVTRVTAAGQTDTFVLAQNPLEAMLVSPQVTIVAVYESQG